MPHIIPIRDLAKTAHISELCNSSNGEPIYVTKNGYADLVVMSARAYDAQVARYKMYEEVMQGLKEASDGKTIDGKQTLAEFKAKYGK